MQSIRQDGNYSFVFSRYAPIAATVRPGETIEMYTEDAFCGMIKEETDLPSKIERPGPNPQTGPVYISGAMPGDTLAVHIRAISITRDFGISQISPDFGGLQGTHFTAMLNAPLENRVFKYIIDGDRAYHPIHRHLAFELAPFMGTIATAPKLEAVSTMTPFEHGGNMDVPDIKPGNTVYLPVAVEGAYFFTGDCHARQGDGELCGTAVEVPCKAELEFEIIKTMKTAWPRIESPTHFMAVGSARPMEDAARIAWCELIAWMGEMGWDKMHAYQMLTQVGEMSLGNMVDTNYSMVAKIDKRYANAIPGASRRF
ncbi:MAG: acetamidase/formamidase family protein [Oscillospiraceae bacterium]|nr:acetamidase/formamidase family protein [Oscillospiraceae bacterium]